jgi:hypothetical protein
MSKYTVRTAREFYSQEQDSQAIRDLSVMGFSFEDWGNGFAAIEGSPEMYVFCIEQIQDLTTKFGEISLTPNEILILNWMNSEDLIPHDA